MRWGGEIGNEDVKTGMMNDSTKGAMCYYYLGPDLGRTRTAVSDVDRMARLRGAGTVQASGGCWWVIRVLSRHSEMLLG